MGRNVHRLSALGVKALKEPGLYADGGGLYLRVSKGENSGRRWVWLYRRPSDGKRCEKGLGGALTVSLADAREKAAELRRLVAAGVDPIDREKAATNIVPTFGELADAHIAAMESGWRNNKHRAQWKMTLSVYARALRSKPVDQITTADVLDVLTPIWQSKPETAGRLRGRIEAVLDAAKVKGFRTGENPAAWRNHLKLVLPARRTLSRGHHAAMKLDDLPAFVARLRDREAVAARCLEFAILTATRSGEALGARWDEIDLKARIWAIPAERMKSARPHRVPLSTRGIDILREMEKLRDGGAHVFPGQRRDKPLSSMALEMVLRRMDVTDATVHGMRSCFRDWAGDRTNYPRELAEQALAHAIGDKAEQAYRRDDALERRRPMMEAWSAFVAGKGHVVDFLRAV